MSTFEFKEFSISQENCAMKVGTDGVLQGAWADPRDAFSVLDIGAGTGLIALQIAQKSYAEVIDALEMDNEAYVQAVENFEQSAWGDRLFCYHASLEEFVDEMENDEEYDFIISNPPFYTATTKDNSIEAPRANARHVQSLSFEELLKSTSRLLSKNGQCAFIIPFQEEEDFLKIASNYNLFPNRITHVRGNVQSEIKRSLLQFSFKKEPTLIAELSIEVTRHSYTPAYIELVKAYYLKM